MSNLIVTVISIALVSAMALSGVWYGGTSYMNNAAKAQAVAIFEQAKQIAAAWRALSVANKGQTDLTDIDWSPSGGNSCNDLVPLYLSQIPRGSMSSSAFWFPANWANPAYDGAVPTVTPVNAVRMAYSFSDKALAACQFYNQTAQNNSTAYKGVNATLLPTYCYYEDNNANNTPDTGDTINFIYKVF